MGLPFGTFTYSKLCNVKDFLGLNTLWQLQDSIKVVCSLTGILSLMGSPYQRKRSPSCTSPWRCWTSSLLLHLQPSFSLNASFPSASVPFPKLTRSLFFNLYLPLTRSCQLCAFQYLGVADWVYANLFSGSPHGRAASLRCHAAVCGGDE